MSVATRIRNSAELVVPFSLAEVWQALSDLARYPEWWSGRQATRILLDKQAFVGSEFEVRPWIGPSFRCQVAEILEPHDVILRFVGGSIEGPGGFHLRTRGGGTLIHYEADVFVRGLMVAIASRIMPVGVVHALQMRLLLRRLNHHLHRRQRASFRIAAEAATRPARESAESGRSASFQAPPAGGSLNANFAVARRYLAALSSGSRPEDLAGFFTHDAVEITYPHRFLDATRSRDLKGVLDARTRHLRDLKSQSYELRSATGGGAQVALEVLFRGVAADGSGPLLAGQEIEARAALLLRFREGRIERHRTYLCFEPRSTPGDPDRAESHGLARGRPSIKQAAIEPPPRPTESNFEIGRRFLQALSEGAAPDEVASFYAADAVQEEYPSRYFKTGAVRDLEGLTEARRQALSILAREHYELRGATGGGSQVVLEVHWTGEAGSTPGSFHPGQRLEAHLAMFLRFEGGLIVRQRTYGCWPATCSS